MMGNTRSILFENGKYNVYINGEYLGNRDTFQEATQLLLESEDF